MKKLVSLLMVIAITTSFSNLAVVNCSASPIEQFESSAEETVMRGEEIMYYYRDHYGVKQYRIWSITYGKWKTDWINC